MKRIIALVVAVAAAGLTACSQTAAPAAAPAGHPGVPGTRVPVSCSQQYSAWNRGQGKGLITTLGAISSAETAGDIQVLTATLKQARPAISQGARHPVPACADPRDYWDVLLQHVSAAAASTSSASSMQAALKGVPKIDHELTAELTAL